METKREKYNVMSSKNVKEKRIFSSLQFYGTKKKERFILCFDFFSSTIIIVISFFVASPCHKRFSKDLNSRIKEYPQQTKKNKNITNSFRIYHSSDNISIVIVQCFR